MDVCSSSNCAEKAADRQRERSPIYEYFTTPDLAGVPYLVMVIAKKCVNMTCEGID